MPWTTTTSSAPGFVADWESISRNTGRQIDWDEVPDTYIPEGGGGKVIAGGTPMAELASGKIVPAVDAPGVEEAFGLLISAASEMSKSDALSGYGLIVGGVIYVNLLPEGSDAFLTELAANGTGFVWETYGDDTEVAA